MILVTNLKGACLSAARTSSPHCVRSRLVQGIDCVAETVEGHRQGDLVARGIPEDDAARGIEAMPMRDRCIAQGSVRKTAAGDAAQPIQLEAPFVVGIRSQMYRTRKGNIVRKNDHDVQGPTGGGAADRDLGDRSGLVLRLDRL